MSVAELGARAAPPGRETALSGWGRVAPSRATVIRPRNPEEVLQALRSPAGRARGVIARGAGRSYGDAAQNGGGLALDMTAWDRICSIDRERRLITAQAGATVAQLLVALAPHGLTLPVLPGTRHVTVGGAIASDIHGKNHHRDGGLARHVVAMSLCTPARGCVEITAASDPGLFYATLGGMGLTGVLLQATLSVRELPSPWLSVDTDRTDGLEQTLELMERPESHRYSVAWLDLLARGAKLGRAIVTRADHLAESAVERAGRRLRGSGGRYPAPLERGAPVEVPRGFPGALLSRPAVGAFNALRWRAAPRSERERPRALAPFFFPLDQLGEWHHLYGEPGLLQYQLVVPAGQEAALVRCFELMRVRRLPVYLAVFKRFGEEFGGPLSFPLAGWTLAVDVPAAAAGARTTLDELDELVAGSGGRVYLSKDARLHPGALRAMYPQLDRFLAERARVDPDGVLGSDLARRVGLAGARG
jgi:decaprenylphospho-beta-D-ribofuranose 2-oxidase